MCGNDTRVASATPSIEGSVPLCPIRFLDQHSPEEVAKYFEKHKHEVPRSHAVCVKRYQSNEASIRQLDAKYGNLVNMIQGLGVKHQPMLPEVDDEAVEDGEEEVNPKNRVQNWAKAVSVTLEDNAEVDRPGEEPAEEDDRQSHFDRDRPLKDIRVGESPSRPWGINVPEHYLEESARSTKSDPTASPLETPQLPEPEPEEVLKAKCPFDHRNMKFAAPPKVMVNDEAPPPSPPQQPPPVVQQPAVIPQEAAKLGAQMVFTGPVFIGYGMEQALALLQQSGFGNKQ